MNRSLVSRNGTRRTMIMLMVATTCGSLTSMVWAEMPDEIEFSKECLIFSPNEGCGVADLNGDDRADVVVAGKTGTWVLTNEGSKQ